MAHLCALRKGRDHVSDSSSEGRRKGREERKGGGREEEKDPNVPRVTLTPVGKTAFVQEGFYFCVFNSFITGTYVGTMFVVEKKVDKTHTYTHKKWKRKLFLNSSKSSNVRRAN